MPPATHICGDTRRPTSFDRTHDNDDGDGGGGDGDGDGDGDGYVAFLRYVALSMHFVMPTNLVILYNFRRV